MGTPVNFTVVSGAHDEKPLCYLLEVDGFTIMLDCGWDDAFDPETIKPLEEVISRVDAVLLSQPDTLHLGALPYLVGRKGMEAPVYGTLPVHKMGQMFMYDHYLSRQACSDFDLFNLDDVDNAFTSNFTTLRYQQVVNLKGKGEGIQITPYPAGHLVGGTIWKITKEGEDIVYAVDYNHKRERHLNGCALESFSRPALLITDAYNAAAPPAKQTRPQRDKMFLESILVTLRRDGNVLIPCDSAGRVLELLLLLDGHWAQNRLGSYPLVFLTSVAYNTMEFAKSMIEWMADTVTKNFETSRDNAFSCRYIHLCHSREELNSLPAGPKVVLASNASLEWGAAKDLLVEWGGDQRNSILFAGRPRAGSVGREISHRAPGAEMKLKVPVSRRVPLEGKELEEHLAKKKREEEAEAAATAAAAGGGAGGAAGVEGGAGAALAGAAGAAGGAGAGAAGLPIKRAKGLGVGGGTGAGARQTTEVLTEGFEVPEAAAAPMFPYTADTSTWDEYGQVIDPSKYAETGGEDDMPGDMDLDPGRMMAMGGGGEAMEMEEAEAPPTKIITVNMNLNVCAETRSFDYEGLADGRSMKTILCHVAPRQMIIIHGSTDATAKLADAVRNDMPKGAVVHCPRSGEVVVAASTASSYKIELSEDLMSRVRFHTLGEYQVAWVEGDVEADANAKVDTGADGEEGEEKALAAPLLHLTLPEGRDGGAHGGVMVGSVKLGELKQALAAAGMPAEVRGGVLLCGADGYVTVRKAPGSEGQLVLEGALCEDYYKVRQLVYGQYHRC